MFLGKNLAILKKLLKLVELYADKSVGARFKDRHALNTRVVSVDSRAPFIRLSLLTFCVVNFDKTNLHQLHFTPKIRPDCYFIANRALKRKGFTKK